MLSPSRLDLLLVLRIGYLEVTWLKGTEMNGRFFQVRVMPCLTDLSSERQNHI